MDGDRRLFGGALLAVLRSDVLYLFEVRGEYRAGWRRRPAKTNCLALRSMNGFTLPHCGKIGVAFIGGVA